MLRRAVLFALGLLVLSCGGAAAELRVVELSEPETLPAFNLVDQDGDPFTRTRFEGHWSLVAIGFTNCPDVCPFVLNNLADVYEQLGLRVRPDNLPTVYFVAVDAARDRPILKEYVSHFHPSFVGATGEWDEISTFVKGIDGFARLGKPDADGNYDVQHTASVIVVAPDGRIQAKLSPPLEPGAVAEYLMRKQIEFRRQHAD